MRAAFYDTKGCLGAFTFRNRPRAPRVGESITVRYHGRTKPGARFRGKGPNGDGTVMHFRVTRIVAGPTRTPDGDVYAVLCQEVER